MVPSTTYKDSIVKIIGQLFLKGIAYERNEHTDKTENTEVSSFLGQCLKK